MQEVWRTYLELALDLVEASKKKARMVARRVVEEGGAKAGQAQATAEDLISSGLANREAVGKLVRYEIDRALGRFGLATAEEVAELTERVARLERESRAMDVRISADARLGADTRTSTDTKISTDTKDGAVKSPHMSVTNTPPAKKAVRKAAKKTVVKGNVDV